MKKKNEEEEEEESWYYEFVSVMRLSMWSNKNNKSAVFCCDWLIDLVLVCHRKSGAVALSLWK